MAEGELEEAVNSSDPPPVELVDDSDDYDNDNDNDNDSYETGSEADNVDEDVPIDRVPFMSILDNGQDKQQNQADSPGGGRQEGENGTAQSYRGGRYLEYDNPNSNNDNDDDDDSGVLLEASPEQPPTSLNTDFQFIPADYNNPNRNGTISSARLNLLTSMVGGGSLSLPLAFSLAGSLFGAPLLLLFCACTSSFTLKALMDAAAVCSRLPAGRGSATHRNRSTTTTTVVSYEVVASAAFGSWAKYLTMMLVTLVCFFGALAYCILVRDLGVPLAHLLHPPTTKSDGSSMAEEGPTMTENLIMFTVVLLTTPLCTLKTLTALRKVGAFSMLSVGVLCVCIIVRSLQCYATPLTTTSTNNPNLFPPYSQWSTYLTTLPPTTRALLSAFPIIQSCFFCHYNAIPVHNELRRPSKKRIQRLVNTTMMAAGWFYVVIGFFGVSWGNCAPTSPSRPATDNNDHHHDQSEGLDFYTLMLQQQQTSIQSSSTSPSHASATVHGNILLDFADGDPWLLVGRFCLFITISLAFPMQVIPARDTVMRVFTLMAQNRKKRREEPRIASEILEDDGVGGEKSTLEEPLLLNASDGAHPSDEETPAFLPPTDSYNDEAASASSYTTSSLQSQSQFQSPGEEAKEQVTRTLTAIVLFWTAAGIAAMVKSVDVVWCLLGSSLVVLTGFVVPCGAFLSLCRSDCHGSGGGVWIGGGGGGYGRWVYWYLKKWCKVGTLVWRRRVAWMILGVYVPLMILCTGNAVLNLVSQ